MNKIQKKKKPREDRHYLFPLHIIRMLEAAGPWSLGVRKAEITPLSGGKGKN